MRLPESVTKIQPVGAVLKASEAGEALLREAGERVNARLLVGQADAAGLSRWEREYGLADRSGEDGARRRARIYAAMAGGQTLTRERLAALEELLGGLHGALDELLKLWLLEGLLDEVHGALLEGLHSLGHVAVAGDENDGQVDSSGRKDFLRFHSAHARHADVKYDAAGFGGNVARKELFGSSIVGNLPAVGFEGESQRFAQGIIVVDDSDEAAGFGL